MESKGLIGAKRSPIEIDPHILSLVKFVTPVPKTVQCIFCEKVALGSWVANCGHVLCVQCLDEIGDERSSSAVCPEDGTDLAPIHQSSEIQREIRTLVTQCPNCDELISLIRLQDHLRRCLPTDIPVHQWHKHLTNNNNAKNKTKPKETQNFRLDQTNCPQLKSSSIENAKLPNSAQAHQMALLRDAMLTLEMQVDRVTRLVRDELNDARDSLKCSTTKLTIRCEQLTTAVDVHDRSLQDLQLKYSDLCSRLVAPQSQINVSGSNTDCGPWPSAVSTVGSREGAFLWKIGNYARLKAKFKELRTGDVQSAPFYSDVYGYKLRAAVDFIGDGVGNGTHISVYICVMKGPYDDVLSWPFQHKVTFMLMDQRELREKNHMAQILVPDPSWPEFKRPISDCNRGRGFHKFAPHSLIEGSRTYLRNDTIYIKVVVES